MSNFKKTIETQKSINEAVEAIFEHFRSEISYAETYETMADAQVELMQLMEINRYVAGSPSLNLTSVPVDSITNFIHEANEAYKLLRPFAKLMGQGYEGIYEVSNLGRVRSLDRIVYRPHPKQPDKIYPYKRRGRILSQGIDTKKYCFVNLKKNGECKISRVHRLVADAFVDGWFDCAVVNHKDENRQNNRADNLEWITFSDNLNYGTARQRSTEGHGNSRPVIQMDLECNLINSYASIEEAGRSTGLDPNHIRSVCKGRPHHHTAGGYRWKFKE